MSYGKHSCKVQIKVTSTTNYILLVIKDESTFNNAIFIKARIQYVYFKIFSIIKPIKIESQNDFITFLMLHYFKQKYVTNGINNM